MTRLALVGAGAWGQNLLRLAVERGVLAAVVDPDERVRALVSRVAPGVPWSPSFEGLLGSRVGLDAALIASPARTHASLAMMALEAGLDVLVEKPLAVSGAEALAVVQRARRGGRVAMVGHLLRYHPAVRRLLEEVERGTIGAPQDLFSWRRSPPGRPSDVSALWALAPHDLSLVLGLTGDPGPLAVLSGRLAPEQATLRVQTSPGLTTQLVLSRCHPGKERRLLLIGAEGALLFDDLDPVAPLRLQRLRGCRWVDEGEPLAFDPAEPLACELDHFLDCVRHRTTPRTPASDGLTVVRWLEGIESGILRGDARGPALPAALEDPGS